MRRRQTKNPGRNIGSVTERYMFESRIIFGIHFYNVELSLGHEFLSVLNVLSHSSTFY